MKNLSVILLVFVCSTQVYALSESFTGDWRGPGKAVMKPGSAKEHKRQCSEVSISLQQTKTTLELSQGFYICEDLQANYDATSFEIRNSELWYQGKYVGMISKDQIHISYIDPDGGANFQLNLNLLRGQLDYEENWLVDGINQLGVSGNLSVK